MTLAESVAEKPKSIPWKNIVTSPPILAITASHVTWVFGFYILLTELPNYMKNVLEFDLKSKAFLSGLPYLAMWIVSILSSILVDFFIGRKIFSTSVARKIANTISTMGPALALFGRILNAQD